MDRMRGLPKLLWPAFRAALALLKGAVGCCYEPPAWRGCLLHSGNIGRTARGVAVWDEGTPSEIGLRWGTASTGGPGFG